jgi:hypothetical protein
MLRNIEATNTALTTSFVEGAVLTTYYKTTAGQGVPSPGPEHKVRESQPYVRDKCLFTYGDPG